MSIIDPRATGALIAERRKELDLSQAELAERLHVTDKAVSASGRQAAACRGWIPWSPGGGFESIRQ